MRLEDAVAGTPRIAMESSAMSIYALGATKQAYFATDRINS